VVRVGLVVELLLMVAKGVRRMGGSVTRDGGREAVASCAGWG